jgi:phosphoribosyl 1,2-cyclic phosphate phosphodiesterase
VTREIATTDIRGQMILLGTGTSVGVPMIGCGCEVCTSNNPRNKRTRCSVVVGLPGGNLLIDTSPDVREQLLREKIGIVHSVLYTHEHADHVYGLDDLRMMQFYLGGAVPLYCEAKVEDRIRKSFDYAFSPEMQTHPGAAPQLAFHRVGLEPFDVLGARITPLRLKHGRRPRGHATHFSLEEAVEIARQLKPRQTYFTHMSHELEHEATNAALPANMALAHDGLRIALT